jgi:hypothetical protein
MGEKDILMIQTDDFVVNAQVEKAVSITPSGFYGAGPENIVEIENFITPEEVDMLITFARNIWIWDKTETHTDEHGNVIYEADYWKDRVATETSLFRMDPEMPVFLRSLQERMRPSIEAHFKADVQPTSPTIVRWMVGQLQNPHADKELHEGDAAGLPNDFPHYDLGCLFYLNDDYEGGELFFPNQGIEFKPKVGAAYFFPGDMNYIHGVREITAGTRYTCPMFWTITRHW